MAGDVLADCLTGKNWRPGENDKRGVSEWRNIWSNGVPDEGRSPELGYRMAAEGIQFPWRWNGGTISTNLDGIWVMLVSALSE